MVEDISKSMTAMGKQLGEFKEAISEQLKNVEVEVQAWNLNIGRGDNEYTIEMSVKVAVRKKK